MKIELSNNITIACVGDFNIPVGGINIVKLNKDDYSVIIEFNSVKFKFMKKIVFKVPRKAAVYDIVVFENKIPIFGLKTTDSTLYTPFPIQADGYSKIEVISSPKHKLYSN